MAESLNTLAEALFLHPKPSPPPPPSPSSGESLLQKLRSDDAIRLGLNAFYSILRHGLESLGDGTLRLQSWNDSQIQAISSFAYAVASATRSLSVEQTEGILVAIVQQSIEFALCYLEKSGFGDDDLGIQKSSVVFRLIDASLLGPQGIHCIII